MLPLLWLLPLALAAFDTPATPYSPYEITCPNENFTRDGDSISPREKEWVAARQKKTNEALAAYLARVGVDAHKEVFESKQPPNIAVALSGGGWRAFLGSAGALYAMDNRTAGEGALGGVLQSLTYLGALSGTSWIMALLALQGFPTIEEVVYENPDDIWNLLLERGLVNLTQIIPLAANVAFNDYNRLLTHFNYWDTSSGQVIKADVEAKQAAGFNITSVDVWGRGLEHQLFAESGNNWLNGVTWLDIQKVPAFAQHDMPFPFVTALTRKPGEVYYGIDSPIVEFNPYETGSFDASINTFHDTSLLGSQVDDGKPVGRCVKGYDQASFVFGISSSLFNMFLNTLVCPVCKFNPILKFFARRLLLLMSKNLQDVALVLPNPFKNSRFTTLDDYKKDDTLYLIDGGLSGELLPLLSLIVAPRQLDAVFAIDNNGPLHPNGLSIIYAYEKQFMPEGKSIVCPYVPGESTFGYYNLTARPTFFGCDAKNQSSLAKDGVVPPLVVYLANRPFEFWSNVSTLKLTYSDREKKGMITNFYDIATRMNSTLDEDWPKCVGCAMVRRLEEREGIEQSEECKKCFSKYCWDGQLYEDPNYVPPGNFDLEGKTDEPMELWGNNEYIRVNPYGDPLWERIGKALLNWGGTTF